MSALCEYVKISDEDEKLYVLCEYREISGEDRRVKRNAKSIYVSKSIQNALIHLDNCKPNFNKQYAIVEHKMESVDKRTVEIIRNKKELKRKLLDYNIVEAI